MTTGYSRLALLVGLGLALPAQAQQVPNPATAPVPTNAALKTAPGNSQGQIRLGFYAAGDGGYARYTWQTTNCTAADDGAQVQPTGTGCWLADFSTTPASVKMWGAKGDSTADDAPAFRAACNWAMSAAGNSLPIYVPAGGYLLQSLAPDGGAVVYLNTGNDDGRSCSLSGPSNSSYMMYSGVLNGPSLVKLGNGLNRPLLRHKIKGAASHIKNLTLDGNNTNQTGWAGGPRGKLFLVQEDDGADMAAGSPETGIVFDDTVLQAGYNGNLYVGAWRYTWASRLWSNYSTKVVGDYSVWVAGFDSVFIEPQIGENQYGGLYLEAGTQHQIFGGSMWASTNGCALAIGGMQVNFATISGTNFQLSDVGVCNTNLPPFPSNSVGGINLTGVTFDRNITADVSVAAGAQINRQMKLTNPSFLGNLAGGTKPIYNIVTYDNLVEVANPTLGTLGSYQTAFAASPAYVYCTGAACPSTAFVPTLGSGTPTYTTQVGWAIRAGGLVHAMFDVGVSSLGGASGNIGVGALPWSAGGETSYFGGCNVARVNGWTAPAGFDWLSMFIFQGENTVWLGRNSKTNQTAVTAQASEFAATTRVTGSCSYIGTH